MVSSLTAVVRGRNTNTRTRSLVAILATVSALIAILAVASSANAAYNILDYKLTASTTQAGGHPKTHYHVDPDATNADSTGGDDLKKVVVDFPAGLLGNPEAANTKCSTTQFNADTCPSTSYIGSMKI